MSKKFYRLMWRDEEVFTINVVDCAVRMECTDHLPFIFRSIDLDNYSFVERALYCWLNNRLVPSYRMYGYNLWRSVGLYDDGSLESKLDMAVKCHCLSIDDDYWISDDAMTSWNDINPQIGGLDQMVSNVSFGDSVNFNGSMVHYDYTTGGKCMKTWTFNPDDGKFYLLKYCNWDSGSDKETIVSRLCDKLGIEHVSYTSDTFNSRLVVKCERVDPSYSIIWGSELLVYCRQCGFSLSGMMTAYYKDLANQMVMDWLIDNYNRGVHNVGFLYDPMTMRFVGLVPYHNNDEAFNGSGGRDIKLLDIVRTDSLRSLIDEYGAYATIARNVNIEKEWFPSSHDYECFMAKYEMYCKIEPAVVGKVDTAKREFTVQEKFDGLDVHKQQSGLRGLFNKFGA